jgi:plastocyanin
MKRTLTLTVVAGVFCLLPCRAGAEAVIEGTVQLPKATGAPAARPRYENKTPEGVGPPEPPVAVVYLEGQFSAGARTNAAPAAQMEQRRFQFAPGILPVQIGSTVEFPNHDDAYHNVFSYSKSKRFDLGRYRKDEKPPALVFDKAGAVKLYCEIHEHMRGTILVLDTPYFVKTDPAGKYRLAHLPAGKYTLKVWLNDTTTLERAVELSDGLTLRADFSGK